MSVTTPDMKWPLLVGAAPVVGAAIFAWDAVQAPADAASSPTAGALLAAVAALGTVVAWWRARRLRAPAGVSVAEALAQSAARTRVGAPPATVRLRGCARPLPDAVPLVSPDGELCLWYRGAPSGPYRDSACPFLLVDDSGECLMLPAGAEVTGHGPVPFAAAADSGAPAERLLRSGDHIQVVGRLVAASPESLALQARAAAAPLGRSGRPLPVIAAPASGEPLGIRIGADAAGGGVYGLLAVADGLVLVASSALVAWATLAAG